MSDPVFLLDDQTDAGPFGRLNPKVIRSHAEAAEALQRHGRGRALCIARKGSVVAALAASEGRRRGDRRLLLLESVSTARRALLRSCFRFIVEASEDVRLLLTDELVEVLASDERSDLFIGGTVDHEDKAVVLYRGNLEPLAVPLSWFRTTASGSVPDFDDFEVTDFGQTVRLGDYEAATDAVLYDFDGDYRRRARARCIEQDDSFGGALRRLRLLRGLRRSDFRGITTKEIARIERGEVKRPHRSTITKLAEQLGVKPDEIESF